LLRFLIAQLDLKLLFGKLNVRGLKGALDKLPDNLEGVYEALMERIFVQDVERQAIAKAALIWITYAKRRLNVHELLHAIAIHFDPKITCLDSEILIDVEDLLSCCLGLVVVNREDEIIRLVHYTTQNYLENAFDRVDKNTSIAKSCLAYLDLTLKFWPVSQEMNPKSEGFDSGWLSFSGRNLFAAEYKLAPYAATYWGKHAHDGTQEELTRDILDVLSHRQAVELLLEWNHWADHYGFTILVRGGAVELWN